MADVPGKFYRATKVRTGVSPSSPGSIEGEVLPPVNPPGSSLNSVGLTMPSAFTVSNSPLTANGTIGVAGAGTVSQYIRGDGSLADFPESSGGGSSVSYYLNGSVDQGTIGGVAYKELNKVPILGAGTDFSISADGYIASFITDAGDPNLLEIPGGNWNFETYFSSSSSGGTPTFYVELYKVNAGGTATLIASSVTSPEFIAFGTTLTPYFSTLAVPTTTLALTDRLAIRYYVTHSGRTITLHTENNHLCQIITTFTTGLTALNGLTAQVQNFAVGTTGTDFNIASAVSTHTFNLPTASATNRGALSSADWAIFNGKQNALTLTTTGTSGAATLVGATLNIPQYQAALTNPVTGTGVAGQIAYFNGTSSITGESNLIWDDINNILQVTGSILPATDNTGIIGNASFTWSNGQFTNLTIDSTLNVRAAIDLADNDILRFGTSDDWEFFHDGTNNLMDLNVGDLIIRDNVTTKITIQRTTGNIISTGGATFSSSVGVGADLTLSAANPFVFGGTAAGSLGLSNIGGQSYIRVFGASHATTPNLTQFVNANSTSFTIAASGAATFSSTVQAGGNFLVPAGSGIAFASDPNRIMTPEDNVSGALIQTPGIIRFNAGGTTPRMTILAGGNVGIATNNPLHRLQVTQAVDGSYPTLGVGKGAIFVAGDTNLYGLYVGVNTTDGNSYFQAMRNDTATAYNMILQSAGGNVLIGTTTSVNHRLIVSSNSDANAICLVGRSSDNGSSLDFFGNNSSTFLMEMRVDSVSADLNYQLNAPMIFYTNATERMRIHQNGNIVFKGQSTTSLAEALFQNTNSALNFFATQTTSFSKDIGFFTDTTTAEERIRIVSTGNILMSFASAGNVIIGTTSDSGDRLRVTGGNGNTFTETIMTFNPENDNRSGVAWRLGAASIASITPNRRLRVSVGGVEYYIGAVEV